MQKLTSLVLAAARVAEVGAFENMSPGARRSPFTVATEAERLANGSTWVCFGVSIVAVRVGTVTFGKMQTVRDAFGCKFMGEVARLAAGALPVLEEVFACGHLGRVVLVPARRPLGAGTCGYSSAVPDASYRDVCGIRELVQSKLRIKYLPVVEKILHGSSFLTTPDRLTRVSGSPAQYGGTYRWSCTTRFATRLPVFVR